MSVTWVIQSSNLFGAEQEATVDAFEALDLNWRDCGVIPFTENITNTEDLEGDTLFFGSTKLIRLVYESDFTPGVFFDMERFTNVVWNLHLHDHMLNSDAFFTKLENVTTYPWPDSWEDTMFVRPNSDLKAFAGEVAYKDCVHEFRDSVYANNGDLSGEQIVAVSPAKKIQHEWRAFLVGGKFVAGSMYQEAGRLKPRDWIPDRVIEYVNKVADIWLPHENVVMDIAEMNHGVLKVVEFNCLNGSGWYETDREKVIKALAEYLEKDNEKA